MKTKGEMEQHPRAPNNAPSQSDQLKKKVPST